jgi:hypothetical protein
MRLFGKQKLYTTFIADIDVHAELRRVCPLSINDVLSAGFIWLVIIILTTDEAY